MTRQSNSFTRSAAQSSRTSHFPQKQRLRLLLVLAPAALENGEICFTGVDVIVAQNVNEAKQILNISDKNFFDAIICDYEVGKKSISEISVISNIQETFQRYTLFTTAIKRAINAITPAALSGR